MTTFRRTPGQENEKRPNGRFYIPSYVYPSARQILDKAEEQIRAAIALKKGNIGTVKAIDFCTWVEENFYIPQTGELVKLQPHQPPIFKLALDRDPVTNYLPYRTFIYSTIKQSGKSTAAGMILQWYAETQQRYSELYCIGNDKEQAKTRSFREVRRSLELTPGYDGMRDRIPGEWVLQKETLHNVRTRTDIRALAVDAKGEAGGKPALQTWTELWGFEYEDAIRFWEELTPIPTIPDSMRIVETYAGYLDESKLLFDLYTQGLEGHQLTAGELRDRTGCELGVFREAPHPDDPVPIWENRAASLLMYWDSGVNARRMPWQLDERGQEYYRQQEISLPRAAWLRLHMNEWSTSESTFIQEEWWDACKSDIVPLEPGDRTPCVMGVDAATTGDCFAIVLVSRHPTLHDEVMIRRVRVYDPKDSGGVVSYDDAEEFIRWICKGGCYAGHPRVADDTPPPHADECLLCATRQWDAEGFNIVHIAYDPYQLESMMQRLRKDQVAWCEAFSQGADRLKADKALYTAILTRTIHHDGNATLKRHILNAGAKVQKDEDSTLRLVKMAPSRKIDAAVALSMASARCLYLVI